MKSGKSVRFVWVPRHDGVFGNEIVDRTAKTALHNGREYEIPVLCTISEIGGSCFENKMPRNGIRTPVQSCNLRQVFI